MARGSSNIGVFNDLTVGSGNYVHSYSLWVGDTDNPGTPSVDTIAYQAGSVVVHNNVLWLALRDNDNVEPTTTNAQDWQQISGTGDSGVQIFRGRWQQNTEYTNGQVVFTDGTTSLFGEAVRNKIYRVERNFESDNNFDTANLAIIGERNTSYGIEAGVSTTANSADVRLVGSDITTDDVTITGGSNVTVVRNSDSQITIDATSGADIPSGNTLPTTGTTAGDFFFLRTTSGTTLPGLYERNQANDAWIPGNTDTNTTYAFTDGTGGTFTVQSTTAGLPNPPQTVDVGDTGITSVSTDARVGGGTLTPSTRNLPISGQRNIEVSIDSNSVAFNLDIIDWDTNRDYPPTAIVKGSDNRYYEAVVTNGPTTSNATNPVGRSDDTVWIEVAYTDAAARAAAVSDTALAGTANTGSTDVAPSIQATNDALAGKQNTLTSDQLAVVNANPFTDADETKLDAIAVNAEETTVTDGTNTLTKYTNAEADMRVALGRTQRVRLDGTILRFYYGTDTTGNGDYQIDIGDLLQIPSRTYADIDTRNADTSLTRVVLAFVADDTGDGSTNPLGNPATYILQTVPSPAGSVTTNDNWFRFDAPDTILNEVPGCLYQPFLDTNDNPSRDPADSSRINPAADSDGFVRVELGETSDTGGITLTDANARFLRLDSGNTEQGIASETIAARARAVIRAAGEDQVLVNGGYPSVGGIALENLGSVTHGSADTYSWPTNDAQVFGENADQITYTAGGGSGNQAVNGVLTNNTGSTIELGNGVLDIDITITAITGSALQANFGLILPGGDATTPVINAPYSVVLPITNFNNLPARLTVRVPIQGSATSAWTNGSTIGLVIDESNSAERPFTYQVNAIRLSYTSHDFHKVGAAADIVFQETDGVITNLDSISIDNSNRLVFAGTTGSLIYAGSGGGSGDVMSSDVITAWTSGTTYDEGRLVYTTTSNRYLSWRRNAIAYSSDPATAETERTNSPDSTDGAALWDVLPPVINATANSPIVVDRNGWNIGTVDHSLRRVSASGNRLDLAPTAITPGTYNNPHITIDQYGRAIGANNGTALADLPHSGFSYTRQDNLSNNLYTNRSQDVYNILGLFLAFNESATDVAQGTELFIFDNGLASTGNHVLTLRRNAEPETDIFEGHTFGFDVIFGFDWLEQFLGDAELGSSTRDLDLTSTAATTAFNNIYIRDTVDRPAVLQRNSSGFVSWVEPDNIIDNSDPTNIATHGAINTAITTVNSRIDGLTTGTLEGLTDTLITSPQDNQTLTYDTTNSRWVNEYAGITFDNFSASLGYDTRAGTQSAAGASVAVDGLTMSVNVLARIGGRDGPAVNAKPILDRIISSTRIRLLTASGVPSYHTTGAVTYNDAGNVATFGVAPTINRSDFPSTFTLAIDTIPDYASRDTPVFTGTPRAPTAEAGTSTTQIATTQFVTNAVGSGGGGGATTFTALTDTPSSYPSGSAGFAVRVNSDEDGLAFVEADDPGRLFNVNERYEAGDLVTTPLATTPISYAVWVLRDGTLDGRTTAIPAANQPGGTGNNWYQVPAGDSASLANDYIVITDQSNDITELTATTPVRFDVNKLTPGTGGTVTTAWFALDGTTPGTGGTVTRADGSTASDALVLQPGLNSYLVTFGSNADTISQNAPLRDVDFRVDGMSTNAIAATYGINPGPNPTVNTVVLGSWTIREASGGNLEFVRGNMVQGTITTDGQVLGRLNVGTNGRS